ncbi:uncharacterized protein METZ01_LOCUS167150 [marine metagenome]|uniref:Uncharacterized protein n=1 Tax=marine metagenome TaxID=408172 RepID=A0A382BKE1_9ZZZZ
MQTERANQMLEIINIDTGDHIPYAGTSLMGHVTTTYDKLVKTFGMPDLEPGDKTTCEWHIEFMVYDEDEGEFPMYATIYDYKEDSTPYGEYRWHVGGHSNVAEELVHDAMYNKLGQDYLGKAEV